MKEITTNLNDAGQRLDKFLIKTFKDMPISMIYRGIRKKRIKVNGKRTNSSYMLTAGDGVQLYINDEFLAQRTDNSFTDSSGDIDVIYEDENILLINKPVGLICHENISEKSDTLIKRVKKYLNLSGEFSFDTEQSFSPALCNRIDRNTSGIVIAAKNAVTLREVNRLIKENRVVKRYLLICEGELKNKNGVIKAYLKKDGNSNTVTASEKQVENSKYSETHYDVLETIGDFSLVSAKLITGRTHQIRVHFSGLGHPILGDKKYDGKTHVAGKKYTSQCLCSYMLEFEPESSSPLSYLAGKSFTLKDTWVQREFSALKQDI